MGGLVSTGLGIHQQFNTSGFAIDRQIYGPVGSIPIPIKHQPIVDTMQLTRHARRLYVGGIPANSSDVHLTNFFNNAINQATAPTLYDDGHPVMQVYMNPDKCFAFIEFHTIEMTQAALQLDYIKYHHPAGTNVVRIRRPNDYKEHAVPPFTRPVPIFNLSVLDMGTPSQNSATISTKQAVSEINHNCRIFIGGIPYHLTDDHVRELLSAFGEIKSFHVVRDAGSPTHKGYGFCEYTESKTAENAIKGLNGLNIGEKALTVKWANPPPNSSGAGGASTQTLHSNQQSQNLPYTAMYGTSNQASVFPQNTTTVSYPNNLMGGQIQPSILHVAPPTKVLKLTNMISQSNLEDNEEYLDIKEEVYLECNELSGGQVMTVVIPRRQDGYPVESEGSIFVQFREVSGSQKSALSLSGRKFDGKIVVVEYYDEIKFSSGILF